MPELIMFFIDTYNSFANFVCSYAVACYEQAMENPLLGLIAFILLNMYAMRVARIARVQWVRLLKTITKLYSKDIQSVKRFIKNLYRGSYRKTKKGVAKQNG